MKYGDSFEHWLVMYSLKYWFRIIFNHKKLQTAALYFPLFTKPKLKSTHANCIIERFSDFFNHFFIIFNLIFWIGKDKDPIYIQSQTTAFYLNKNSYKHITSKHTWIWSSLKSEITRSLFISSQQFGYVCKIIYGKIFVLLICNMKLNIYLIWPFYSKPEISQSFFICCYHFEYVCKIVC